jgi:hypothetical protein
MALGVAADADDVDAVFLQQPRFDDLQRILERPLGLGRIAGDNECGIGSKPSSRTSLAAATLWAISSPGRKVTATCVPGRISGAASLSPSSSLAVISSE